MSIDDLDSVTLADNVEAAAMAGACILHVKTHLSSGTALKKRINEATTPEELVAIVDDR